MRRALGRQAVDDMEALRQIERELERQGYLQRTDGKLELTPKAVRRLGETALRRVFAELPEGGTGDHDQHDAGQAGEYTGSTRPWSFGDEQAIDAPTTVRNALLRAGLPAPREPEAGSGTEAPARVRLSVSDFEVGETERRTTAAVCLLVDLSYSMALRGTWGVAKQTALALHALIRSKYPQDSIQVIGFSNYARELRETDLAGLGWDMVQGTNLHHALILAGRFLDRRPEQNPVVLVVTDGEPTAHLRRDGQSWFDWPPSPGDARAHPGRGGQDDQAPGDDERLHARRGRAAHRLRRGSGPAQRGPGAPGGAGEPGRVRGQGLLAIAQEWQEIDFTLVPFGNPSAPGPTRSTVPQVVIDDGMKDGRGRVTPWPS